VKIGKTPVDDYRMPVLEHIRELRTRLVISIAALAVGVGVGLLVAEPCFAFLVEPLTTAIGEGAGELARLKLFEGILTYLKVGLLVGILLASPVIFYQLWIFVAPGLYKEERRVVVPLMLASTSLFLSGAAFGYFVIFRFGFPYFLSVFAGESIAMLSIGDYLATATRLLLAFGFCFQLPIVVFFLARIGLVNGRDMAHAFRYAIVGIFAVSALITPPDPLTQVLMAAPLTLLYGVGIGVAAFFTTKGKD
jgi:sec-independent protein translocase protein TatC